MKHFFAFIFAFFYAMSAIAGDVPFYQTPEFGKFAQEFVAYMEQLQQKNIQAMKNEKVGSFLEDADRYNALSPLYLAQTDTSPLSGTRGYGNYTEFPFGKARLVSCYSGINGNRAVFAAVQILSKPDWYFYKPDIQIISETAQKPIVSAPLNLGQNDGEKRDFYYNAMFFPIILELKDTTSLYDLTADIAIKACQKQGCETFKTSLHLPLTHQERYPTGICPLLMQVLQQTPLPPIDGTTVHAIKDDTKNIQLFFEFADTPKVVNIQTDNDWTFEVVSKNIKGNLVSAIIKPSRDINQGETIMLKAVTTQRSYDLPVVLKTGTFKPLAFPFAWGTALIGGFLLFFFTPFFGLFLLYAPRTKKAVRQTGKEITLSVISFTFLFALAYQAKLIVPLPLIQSYPILAALSGLLLIGILIRPKMDLLGAFLCLLLLPKPYLDNVFDTMPPGSLYPFFVTLFWGITLSLPFYLMYKKPDMMFQVFKVFKAAAPKLNNFIRLPFLLLLGWLLIGGIGNAYINRKIPLFTPERLQTALDAGKIVFVSVENPVCLQCVWNKGVALKTGYARPLYKQGRIEVLRVDAQSETALEFKMKHDKSSLPLNVLFGIGNKGGLLLPDYLAYTELLKYLAAVLKIQ